MQNHEEACEEAAGNETFEECCTQKKIARVCQSPASFDGNSPKGKRFATHIFKTQKTIKLNAHGERDKRRGKL